jgi:hypothetical protein
MYKYFLKPKNEKFFPPSGQTLSPQAATASSAGELFDLFFSAEMMDLIVRHTNRYRRYRTGAKHIPPPLSF